LADISILEFIVYGFITYSSLLMLIISTVKEVPTEKSGSIIRGIWLIPGIFCAFILASSGVNIITEDTTVSNQIVSLNTTEVWTETVTTQSLIELQNPIWVTVHLLIFMILIVYVIIQILTLFTKLK
jgi:ABC-type thiamin/hydroxymethylpyrimidine transport system permease subunit